MHRASVVRQEQTALSQFLYQLFQCGLSDQIAALITERVGDFMTDRGILLRSKKNPFATGRRRHCGKAFREPALGRAVFRARAKTDILSGSIRSRIRHDRDLTRFPFHA